MSGDAEEPLLRRLGATVSSTKLVNAKLLHNPKFRALLVESVRGRDWCCADEDARSLEGSFARVMEGGDGIEDEARVDARDRRTDGDSRATTTQLFALTTFAFMAKQTAGLAGPDLETLNACGLDGCGFTNFYQFKGIVGVYAAFWVYSVVLIGLYAIRRAPPPGTELTVHVLFTLMMIIFWFMSVIACSNTVLESDYTVCKNATYGKTSLVFAFFCVVLNSASCVFCWRQWGETRYVGLPSKLSPTSFAPATVTSDPVEFFDDDDVA